MRSRRSLRWCCCLRKLITALSCHVMQARVGPFRGKQLLVRTDLHHLPLAHHHDPVSPFNRGQTVGNHQGGAATHERVKFTLNMTLSLTIECRSRLIEDEHRCVFQKRARNCDALALPTGESHTVFAKAMFERSD